MEILYNSIVKKEDGSVIFEVTSHNALKHEFTFLEDDYVWGVVAIKKLPGSDYISLGTAGKRQRFKIEVIVKPIHHFDTRRQVTMQDLVLAVNTPTAATVMRTHRIYQLEQVQSALLRTEEGGLYG